MVPAGSRWLPDGRGGMQCGLECGFPRRGCGRESGCKDAFDQLLFPRVPLRYALPDPMWWLSALAPVRDSQRQRKEKQFNAMTTPTRSAPSATGRQLQKSQKTLACPTARQNRRLHRYADPRRAEGHCTGARPSAFFSSTGRGAFSFWARPKREWGAHPCGNSPWREPDLRGRRPAAHQSPHGPPPIKNFLNLRKQNPSQTSLRNREQKD